MYFQTLPLVNYKMKNSLILIPLFISIYGFSQSSSLTPQKTIMNANSTGSLLAITNTNPNNSDGINGTTLSQITGAGIRGSANATSPTGHTYGLFGENNSTNHWGSGVYGIHRSSGFGVFGESFSGAGIMAKSDVGIGLYALTNVGASIIGTSTSGDCIIAYAPNGIAGTFISDNSNAFVSKGQIGLGTLTPNLNVGEEVDIYGRVRIQHNTETGTSAGIWFNNDENTINSDNGAFIGLETATPNSERVGIKMGNTWHLVIDRNGNACLGGVLQSNGACSPSDLRYKKNIQPITHSLKNILRINGVNYEWRNNEFPERSFSDKKQIGFIAQEIEKIYPEMVFTDEKGYKSVDYAKITPVLVEAIKEQQKQIEELKVKVAEIDKLKLEWANFKKSLSNNETSVSEK